MSRIVPVPSDALTVPAFATNGYRDARSATGVRGGTVPIRPVAPRNEETEMAAIALMVCPSLGMSLVGAGSNRRGKLFILF